MTAAEPQIDFLSPPAEPLSWKQVLAEAKQSESFKRVMSFVESERGTGKTIFPKNADVFSALAHTPFEKVKVAILGQDPYHGPNQAHGLCFSVRPGIAVPPSLQNIYKELATDVGFEIPTHGYLTEWADQGVLLLNSVLTVEAHNAGSHAGKGWEQFTDEVIAALNRHREGLVFLLWGSYAQKKGAIVDRARHTVLTAPHPSPLSAHRGFFGCKHFSQANTALEAHGLAPINWQLSQEVSE